MKYFLKKYHLLLLLLLITPDLYSQEYCILNEKEEIRMRFLCDSIEFQIKNVSDKSILLPIEKIIEQGCSVDNKSTLIGFGIDLQVFNERGIVELVELKPEKTMVFKEKLISCNYNTIHFSYQFYMRDINKIDGKWIYNTDFINDKKWLKKGYWEWGELKITLE